MPGVVRQSLVDQVIEQIGELISTGRWPVDARIPPEPALITTFGVARNTLREAVRALAHAGVLDVRHGDGTYVRAISETEAALHRWLSLADVLDVLTVRRGLEVEAARQAADRHTPDDLTRLTRLLDRLAPPPADRGTRVANALDFHSAVVDTSHNPVLIQLYRSMTASTSAAMTLADTDPTLTNASHAAHLDLLSAIRDRDPDRAAHAAATHLQPLIDSVRRQLDP